MNPIASATMTETAVNGSNGQVEPSSNGARDPVLGVRSHVSCLFEGQRQEGFSVVSRGRHLSLRLGTCFHRLGLGHRHQRRTITLKMAPCLLVLILDSIDLPYVTHPTFRLTLT